MSGKKTVAKDSGEIKESRGEILVRVCECLHPIALGGMVPLRHDTKLPKDFRIVNTKKGSRYWVQVGGDSVVRPIDVDVVKNAVASAFSIRGTYLPPKDVDDVVKMAMLNAEAMDDKAISAGCFDLLLIDEDEIAPVRFKSGSGWCWHRLPYDPDTSDEEAAAYWQAEVFPRFQKNRDPFMAWCGSLFDPQSPRVLCPWLYGEGESGKGTLAMFIMQCMGEAGTTVDPEHLSFDKFALEILEGIRFAFIDEAPAKLVTSAKFKRTTGERYQMVNRKGQKAVMMRVDAKFMYASNQFPTIRSGKEFARRIMPVPFVAIAAPERNKEQVLAIMHRHAAYFWGVAMEEYSKNRELKKFDTSEVEEFQDDETEIIDLWIQKNIDTNATTYFPVRTAMDAAERDKKDWYKVKKRLTDFYNVKSEPRKINGTSFRCLIKCAWKGHDFGAVFSEKEDEIDF